ATRRPLGGAISPVSVNSRPLARCLATVASFRDGATEAKGLPCKPGPNHCSARPLAKRIVSPSGSQTKIPRVRELRHWKTVQGTARREVSDTLKGLDRHSPDDQGSA